MGNEHRENPESEVRDLQGSKVVAPLGGATAAGDVLAARPRSAELAGGQSSAGSRPPQSPPTHFSAAAGIFPNLTVFAEWPF